MLIIQKSKPTIPWYRSHIVIINDPSRLLATHLMHTSIISGWSSFMLSYESYILDNSDPTYNPNWRQGTYVIPFTCRLGTILSTSTPWTLDIVSVSHLLLSGLLALSSIWHWYYWDLSIFLVEGTLILDLLKVFSIHLLLASIVCASYGIYHLSGIFGPGLYTSDSYGILSSVRPIKSSYSLNSLTSFTYGAIPSHHIVSGILGTLVSIWHLASRPGPTLYNLLSMSNIESVLSNSIPAVFLSGLICSGTMWYGGSTTVLDIYGPTRYNWDNSYFSLDIESRVKTTAWSDIPDKLLLYDYIGCNPAKGGLFRSGPQLQSDGIVQNWIGHPLISVGTLPVTVRRMPAFFETFPVLLIDQSGTVRSDIPFRRASSTFSIEQTKTRLSIVGGILNGSIFTTAYILKTYLRKSQFGEIFSFDRTLLESDGVYRTTLRGWYSFTHVSLSLIFLYGHLWHGSRTFFEDIWTGISELPSEYGSTEKLGSIESKPSLTV